MTIRIEENYLPANDAATAPHQRDAGVIERPLVVFRRLTQQHESLSVGNNFGCVQGLADVVEKLFLVTGKVDIGTGEEVTGCHALLLQS